MQEPGPSKVLDAWREAERARDVAEPGSAEWEHANQLANALREEYGRVFDQQQSDNPLTADMPGLPDLGSDPALRDPV